MAGTATDNLWSFLLAIIHIATFWQRRLWQWCFAKSKKTLLLETLQDANCFEEWEAAAMQLDIHLDYDLWRQNPSSKRYDYRLIHARLSAIYEAGESGTIFDMINLVRNGLVRNIGNITVSRLYNRAYAGTKLLIEDYISHVVRAIQSIIDTPTGSNARGELTQQMKLDTLHDSRLAYGRTALVLQGGAIFGLCHLGVVKALLQHGLLPRIIAGTATGAIIAALVGVHAEDELLDILEEKRIDITAFANRPYRNNSSIWRRYYETFLRRLQRWRKEGHFFDISVLEELLKANIGDITFEEAYNKTKRVLNITVSTSAGNGVPNLLNYLTAPNVLIWSAALASNAMSSPTSQPEVTLLCKDENDEIRPWAPAQQTTFRPWTHATYSKRDSPLHRIGELFNVNHYIVSQARPYLVPFLRSDLTHPSNEAWWWRQTMPILRLTVQEIQHRLQQANQLGWLGPSIRRFVLDESVPGPSLTIVPELTPRDFAKLLENPTRAAIDYWVLKGERSVWPAVTSIKIRMAIEVELDRGYQLIRRRKPTGNSTSSKGTKNGLRKVGSHGEVSRKERGSEAGDFGQRTERRRRARSFGEG